MTDSFEPLWRMVDGLVHGSAGHDRLMASRHRAFIGAHLAAGLGALLMLPLWLALRGPPSLPGALTFAWLAAPLPIALFLSRTGRYERAHLMSAASLAGLVVLAAWQTGGLASPALIWLAAVPAEAALSGSRRTTFAALGAAVGGLGLLAAASMLTPATPSLPPSHAFAALVTGGAILYAGAVALRAGRLHREAVQAAFEGEGLYRLLADNATDLITRHAAGGATDYASPAARLLLGCSPSALAGSGLFDRVHVADRPAFLLALSETERTGAPRAVEFRLRHADRAAGFVTVEMRCRPAVDPSTGRRSIVAMTRDVTLGKAQAEALVAATRAAEQANVAKGRFLANMSHELRTPLNAIIGFSEILERELFGRFEFDRQRDYARLIHASGAHLLEVVNSVLDMSKIEAGAFDIAAEAFPARGLVDNVVEIMSQKIASRGLKLVKAIDRDLPDFYADRRACRQILLNLLANAVKFTEAGGVITVTVRAEGRSLLLEVADTGIGIAAEDLPRLGQPFVQADADYDRRYEGTGLGLSVVKGLATLQGGSFAIRSELRRGTTVTVQLPSDAKTALTRIGPAGAAFSRERKIA